MKKKSIISCILLLILSCASGPTDKPAAQKTEPPEAVNKIAGIWEYENPLYAGSKLQYNEDFTVNVIFEGEDPLMALYKVDYSTDPIQLDVTWEGFGTMATIIRFLDDNKLQIENNDIDSPRPDEFTDNSNMLIRVQ